MSLHDQAAFRTDQRVFPERDNGTLFELLLEPPSRLSKKPSFPDISLQVLTSDFAIRFWVPKMRPSGPDTLIAASTRPVWSNIGTPTQATPGSLDRKSTRLNSSHRCISY